MKITITSLTKVFAPRKKTEHEVTAVNNMNIEIPSGKLVGLLGPSGCGKSTTLFMLSGLEEPTEGHILFGDDDVTFLSPDKRGIGLVFQNYALYPHMTVEQNIMFPLLNMKINKEEAKQRAYDAAALVQIEDLLKRKPNELSGGQQQRVAIARALVKMPNVLLLDEPLSNLDARLRIQTREEIKRIQQETGITTVFVTHDQEEAMSICDIMVVMKLGVVQQVGEPQHIYDDPDNLFVANFLGTPPINVFNAEIKGKTVYIGSEKVIACKDYTRFYQNLYTDFEIDLEDKTAKYNRLQNEYEEKTVNMDPQVAQKRLRNLTYKIETLGAEIESIKDKMEKIQVALETKEFPIYMAIRPEGFIPNPKGTLRLELDRVEIMGRDKTVVSKHEASVKPAIRSIIEANVDVVPEEVQGEGEGATSHSVVAFDLKPEKYFLFDALTEMRLR